MIPQFKGRIARIWSGRQDLGAADKAAILLVKVQPHQLLVLDAKRYHGLGQVTNQEVAWCKRPGCRAGESLRRWVQSGGLASVGA